MSSMTNQQSNAMTQFVVVVPAAGIGKRMQAVCPKQYLTINNLTILEHTIERLLSHPKIEKIILSLNKNDDYFEKTSLANRKNVITVLGGEERVDSVLAGLTAFDKDEYPWVMVHDAARPCITHKDIDALIESCIHNKEGGLLAVPVRDTMKREAPYINKKGNKNPQVKTTVERSTLWHALTPQMYRTKVLITAITQAQADQQILTDESSAIEYVQLTSLLVQGSSENIKITQPDDLALATFILAKQQETVCE